MLNVRRACEAALDIGQYLIRTEQLGIPQSARDIFTLLASGGIIDQALADRLKKMVGYRNIAVHQYQDLLVAITIAMITQGLDDLLDLASIVLRRQAGAAGTQQI